VVWAHIRRFGWGGMGLKPHDALGCYCCFPCHDKLDGRAGGPVSDTDILRALGESLLRLIDQGILTLKK
jgi:hypothetical protein